jgi:hypothetical protein
MNDRISGVLQRSALSHFSVFAARDSLPNAGTGLNALSSNWPFLRFSVRLERAGRRKRGNWAIQYSESDKTHKGLTENGKR